jgi:hypothetical protein
MKAVLSLIALLGVSNCATADMVAIAICRSIADSAARLSCYDKISLPDQSAPVPVAKVAPRSASPTEPSVTTSSSALLTPPPAAASPRNGGLPASTIGSAGSPVPNPVVTPSVDASASFGLESRAPVAASDVLVSSIVGAFPGWRPNGRIQLANGQIWQVTDGSEAAYDLRDPAVRLTRGFAGTFFIEISGVSQTPRVRRVR